MNRDSGASFVREAWLWGVMRPDFIVVEGMLEDEARGYVQRGNADGQQRYTLLRRPVGPWEVVPVPTSEPLP